MPRSPRKSNEKCRREAGHFSNLLRGRELHPRLEVMLSHDSFRCTIRIRDLDYAFIRQLADACRLVSTPSP